MAIPEGDNDGGPLAQSDAAPQRSAISGAAGAPQARGRGPHPLPHFLGIVTRACAGDAPKLQQVLAGLRRYQHGPVMAPRPLRPVVARAGGVTLRDFGGAGPVVVVVPSLINPATVLDLADGNSFMDGLAARGLRALLVDWGPTEAQGLEALVADRLVPLLAGQGAPVALVGYCLGGTLAIGAAARLGPAVSRLALLATPWHFSGYGEARARLADWWARAGPLSQQLGALPIELLQPAFWALDEAGVVGKYARLAAATAAEVATFAALEDWSNSGEPLSLAAAAGLAETLFAGDATGRGEWRIGGEAVDPKVLAIPILDIIAMRDRIVPAAAALSTSGIGTPLALDAGHVGMVVGGRAPALLWHPLAQWLKAP